MPASDIATAAKASQVHVQTQDAASFYALPTLPSHSSLPVSTTGHHQLACTCWYCAHGMTPTGSLHPVGQMELGMHTRQGMYGDADPGHVMHCHSSASNLFTPSMHAWRLVEQMLLQSVACCPCPLCNFCLPSSLLWHEPASHVDDEGKEHSTVMQQRPARREACGASHSDALKG